MDPMIRTAAAVGSCIPRHADNVTRMNMSKSQAGAVLGSSTSEKKAHAAQKNGEKGGRPKGS